MTNKTKAKQGKLKAAAKKVHKKPSGTTLPPSASADVAAKGVFPQGKG
jgi:hypothetical protein